MDTLLIPVNLHYLIHGLIILTAIGGFLVASKIHKDKKKGRPFVCPLNFDCHAVTSSSYSKLLGIPLEYYGMAYYLFIIFSYAFLMFVPSYSHPLFAEGVIALSVAAFVFSAFLTWVQAVRLKNWCSWCLVSACLSTVILGLVIWLYLI